MTDVKNMLASDAEDTENYIKGIFESGLCGSTRLREAAEYSLLGGGKRIRAALAIEFCRMFGGDTKSALPFAAAIEMIHAFSLVHDDMPCMDNDDMRRGKPSCHKAYGEAEALLCGDELFCLAFEVMTMNSYVPDSTVRRAVGEFARCAGALGMIGGQHYDLCEKPETYDELVRLHRMKTGALIAASCLNGYYAAEPEPSEEICRDLRKYAYALGLAFQITDDILDVTSDEQTLGKPIGSDEENGKVTSLTFLSLEEASNEAERVTKEAISAIKKYPSSEALCDLAKYLRSRSF